MSEDFIFFLLNSEGLDLFLIIIFFVILSFLFLLKEFSEHKLDKIYFFGFSILLTLIAIYFVSKFIKISKSIGETNEVKIYEPHKNQEVYNAKDVAKEYTKEAKIAYEAHDYPKAFELYTKGCDGDNVYACKALGYMYEKGNGVIQNQTKAFELYKKACDGGNTNACNNLTNY